MMGLVEYSIRATGGAGAEGAIRQDGEMRQVLREVMG
jgi:hypothetical protein